MREILFRAKAKFNGSIGSDHWIESSFLHIKKCGDSHSVTLGGRICDEETLGQFTGLTDKNGKKIFEGDIVIFGESKIHRICWDDKGFWVARNIIQNNYHYNGVALHVIGNGEIEVIGNIHDNPELVAQA
ncbi:MAG: hypothetical protein EOM15_11970 [Spirochaetia bacterium]|nr:hypothetical protein [Spirochaetia bacterium]